eukprot:GHUV01031728.1.p1 GENE.GHUV01031728.1~~GHUV01031728.1.p1  ORF type:complete len:170 (+),score=19.22 GHUV01031728.1:172-681(+)
MWRVWQLKCSKDIQYSLCCRGLAAKLKPFRTRGGLLLMSLVQEAFNYIRSYSPYDNINPNATYPAMLLTASLHDTRVNYWEPAKYVAAMRYNLAQRVQQQRPSAQQRETELSGPRQPAEEPDRGTAGDERPLLLLTDMDAGHFAASSASRRLQDRARKVAFILRNLECS